MEKDFYTDEFEQLLRDTTDDFRMYPSRKVWHSIYNDLHPAKKWPSFAVSLLLITAILYIGIDNNNAINADADNIVLATFSPSGNNNNLDGANVNTVVTTLPVPEAKVRPLATAPGSTLPKSLALDVVPVNYRNTDFLTFITKSQSARPASAPVNLVSPHSLAAINLRSISDNALQMTAQSDASGNSLPRTTETIVNLSLTNHVADDNKELPSHQKDLAVAVGATTNPRVADNAIKTSALSTAKSADEKAWIDNYAFHSARKGNKWKTKLSTLVYITPSVGYRVLNRNNSFEPVNALLIRSSNTSVDADDAITQQAALNLESGATAILDLSRRLRVKAGVQFNYTNYVSSAERLSHPTQTNLLLNDLSSGNTMLVPVSSTYGNNAGMQSVKLNNNTIQFSLPVGADFKVAGNDKFKWYVGATIQPTYVAGGNAYLVSSDYKNYVDMPSMLRTWNVNAGFESFVSYKTKGGSVINLGPQFRYQLLSTYSSRYAYSENLYNVGVKVGITRKF